METKSLPNGWGLNSDSASPHLRIFYPWFATLPQSPGCGARSCFPKLPSASPICPRASASPPEAHEMNALYLCGRSLEWANWKLGSWDCELPGPQMQKSSRRASSPRSYVYINLPWDSELQHARALFGGQPRLTILPLSPRPRLLCACIWMSHMRLINLYNFQNS